MATVRFCYQSDEKPPPGSQLLVTQQVSHVCYIVLFASMKTGCHVVSFSEISSCLCVADHPKETSTVTPQD